MVPLARSRDEFPLERALDHFAAVVGLSTLTLLLFWFIGAAVAVQSMFGVGGQVKPLIGGI